MNGMKLLLTRAVLLLLILAYGCSSSGTEDSLTTPPPDTHANQPPEEITFAGIGEKGIFDPALAYDPATQRIWMSYSAVDASFLWPDQNDTIGTRLAHSDDAGRTWQDDGVINAALDVPSPQYGTWNNEVPSIMYDPGAPSAERWKLLWHHYLWVNGQRTFQFGWIAMKSAPSPEELASAAERKLFVGSFYNNIADDYPPGNPPEVHLDQLHPELNGCLTFSEPGMVATPDALYVVLLGVEDASDPTKQRILLLKWPHPGGPWEYRGTFLNGEIDGAAFGYDGFSAPNLFVKNNQYYLLVTPQTNNMYLGVFLFDIDSIEAASLRRTNGVPDLVYEFQGTNGSHNGAAGYVEASNLSGMLYSEVLLMTPFHFRIYKSFINP